MEGDLMPERSSQDWSEYLALFEQVGQRLSKKPWFADGWETRVDFLNRANPTGVWMQLVRKNWFDGAIHLETWVRKSVLERGTLTLALHIETSIPKHGLSRNDFTRLFLERCGDLIGTWPGYTVKPNYAMEPFSTQIPFTRETLVPNLEAELERVHELGPAIDAVIAAVKR
jgi:hypothetical protein